LAPLAGESRLLAHSGLVAVATFLGREFEVFQVLSHPHLLQHLLPLLLDFVVRNEGQGLLNLRSQGSAFGCWCVLECVLNYEISVRVGDEVLQAVAVDELVEDHLQVLWGGVLNALVDHVR